MPSCNKPLSEPMLIYQCNVISHWLGSYTNWSLEIINSHRKLEKLYVTAQCLLVAQQHKYLAICSHHAKILFCIYRRPFHKGLCLFPAINTHMGYCCYALLGTEAFSEASLVIVSSFQTISVVCMYLFGKWHWQTLLLNVARDLLWWIALI